MNEMTKEKLDRRYIEIKNPTFYDLDGIHRRAFLWGGKYYAAKSLYDAYYNENN
jgi:hypothetical protein